MTVVAGVAAKHLDMIKAVRKEKRRIERDFDKGGIRIKFEKGLTEKQRDKILGILMGSKSSEMRTVRAARTRSTLNFMAIGGWMGEECIR